MAACPSDGFVDSALGKLHDYLFRAEQVVLNCPQASPCGYEIPCLGIFDRDGWALLMLLASQKPVCLVTGVCSDCLDREACELSVRSFQAIHQHWAEHPELKLQVKPVQGDESEAEGIHSEQRLQQGQRIERREVFSGWREKSREKIATWLPSLKAEEKYAIPLSRQWLSEALRELPDEKIPFLTLQVNDNCTSCGVCVDICPQEALAQWTDEDGQIRLVFEPVKCVQCDRCGQICLPKAIELTSKRLNSRLLTGKVLLHTGRPRLCSKCGKQVFNAEEPPLCLACATSEPVKHGFFF